MVAVALPGFVHICLKTALALFKFTSLSIMILGDLLCPFPKAFASFPEVLCPRMFSSLINNFHLLFR